MPAKPLSLCRTSLAVLCGAATIVHGAGIFRDGQSARAMALGGNETATAAGPLDALSGNPGALSEMRGPTLDLGVTAGFARGKFRNAANDGAAMSDSGYLPHAAIGVPVGRATIGLGLLTAAGMRSDWQLRDAPGGLGGQTSYGLRSYQSEIILLRAALGVSWQVCDELSAGASLGLLYNENRLQAPYTFQTQPALRSAKVLLDLETEGHGWKRNLACSGNRPTRCRWASATRPSRASAAAARPRRTPPHSSTASASSRRSRRSSTPK